MSRLHEIPVHVEKEPAAETGPGVSIVLAMLAEIKAKLDVLLNEGQESTIDLRCLIGMPQELDLLRQLLGQGEVAATVTTVGTTLAQETAVPCVWWLSHSDPDGGKQGEFIDITEVPELLRSDRFSIAQGLTGLHLRCAQLDTPVAAFSHRPV